MLALGIILPFITKLPPYVALSVLDVNVATLALAMPNVMFPLLTVTLLLPLANTLRPAAVFAAVAMLATLGTPATVATVVTVPVVVNTVAVGFGTAAVAAGAIATAPVTGSAVIVAPVEPPMLRPFCTIKFAFAIFLPFSLHCPRNLL
jgi:hypothetical protein